MAWCFVCALLLLHWKLRQEMDIKTLHVSFAHGRYGNRLTKGHVTGVALIHHPSSVVVSSCMHRQPFVLKCETIYALEDVHTHMCHELLLTIAAGCRLVVGFRLLASALPNPFCLTLRPVDRFCAMRALCSGE